MLGGHIYVLYLILALSKSSLILLILKNAIKWAKGGGWGGTEVRGQRRAEGWVGWGNSENSCE